MNKLKRKKFWMQGKIGPAEQACINWQDTGDEKYLTELINRFRRFAYYKSQFYGRIVQDELESILHIAVWNAALKWNKESKCRFSTYLGYAFKQQAAREMETNRLLSATYINTYKRKKQNNTIAIIDKPKIHYIESFASPDSVIRMSIKTQNFEFNEETYNKKLQELAVASGLTRSQTKWLSLYLNYNDNPSHISYCEFGDGSKHACIQWAIDCASKKIKESVASRNLLEQLNQIKKGNKVSE